MSETLKAAAEMIRDRAGSEPIETAIVFGTSLGATFDAMEDSVAIPYEDIPGFPKTMTSGHEGRLVLGRLEGVRVACLCGRAHYYERGDPRAMAAPLATMAELGARTLLLTCAAGSTNADIHPGTLVLVTDHINLNGLNPLIGGGSDEDFVAMTDAYDARIIKRLKRASAGAGVALREGVYMWFSGPSFETPAEIRMARTFGADLVGMSLVPEVILARRLAIRVGAVSVVTNFGAGFLGGAPSHAQTHEIARQGSIGLRRLIRAFFKSRDEAWGSSGRETLR